jgi:hypothetical protein
MSDSKRVTRAALFSAVVVLAATSVVWAQVDPAARRAEKEQRYGALERDGERLMRTAAAGDRALMLMNISKLEVRTLNYGPIGGTDGWAHTWYPRPDGSGTRDNFFWESHFNVGIAPGPWNAIAQVHDAYDQGTSKGDWEAMDGALGGQFSDPPQTFGAYPLAAHSDLPLTWPAAGWPAPEAVAEVWLGTETWNKWQRIAEREAFALFDDSVAGRDGLGGGPVGLTVSKRVLGYGTQDAAFFQFEVENTGTHTLTGVYVGQTVDAGGPTVNSWGGGGPRWDPARNALYVMGWNYQAGAGTHLDENNNQVGWVAHVWLESPTGSLKRDDLGNLVDNPANVLTRLALFDWGDNVQNYEEGLYGALSADLTYMAADPGLAERIWKISQSPGGATPILMQNETHYRAYNPGYASGADPFFYASAGPVTLAPGETMNYLFALVAAATEIDLKVAVDKAIQTYQAQFATSGPPPSPLVSAAGVMAGPSGIEYDPRIHAYPIYYAESGKATLTWDGSASETAPDAVTGVVDFQGYKLYRSHDRGRTWGEVVTDNRGRTIGWTPMSQWDLEDDVTGDHPLNNFYLGDDSGIVHSFVDEDVVDGVEYWYSVTAYDFDLLEPAYESAIGVNPGIPNTVAVITGARTPGFVGGTIGTGAGAAATYMLHNPADPDKETVIRVSVVSDAQITGDAYRLWVGDHFVDPSGTHTHRGGIRLENTTTTTWLHQEYIRGSEASLGNDNIPVVDGFRIQTLQPNNADGGLYQVTQTAGDPEVSFSGVFWVGPEAYMEAVGSSSNRANVTGFMSDVELRFTGFFPAAGDTNWAHDAITLNPVLVPFQLWDTDTNTRLYPIVYDYGALGYTNPGEWDGWDIIVVTSAPYQGPAAFETLHPLTDAEYWGYNPANPASRSDWIYRIAFDEDDPDHEYWAVGDVWLLEPYKTLKYFAGNDYPFTTTAPTSDQAEVTLENVRVVPNPYFMNAAWDISANRRKMQFRNVPAGSTVDIYTVAGELVASLSHEQERGYQSSAIGTVEWNLWTYEYTEAAYGLYIYVVKAPNGDKKIGKFAIIR